MTINIKRYFLPLAAVLFMAGCHEAVEPEAIDVNYSSFEETNPELYARYMQALREYKAGSHKAVFVTMTVPESGAATTHRTQHFTAIPDSVDFIVVNPVPAVLCQTLVDEIRKVHEKGTRVLFNIDLQTFENDWTQVLKADPTLSEEDALAYLGGRVGEQIALVDRWGYDGFIFTYTGKDRIFTCTTDQLADIGTYCNTSLSYQLDTVFRNSRYRRSINHFRVYRHLYSFEYVTSCQVDSSSHLERQFDVGFRCRY